jgi:hypothetical protein
MNTCPRSGTPLKQIPAGVSKTTGKAYDAFWVCDTKGCKGPHIPGASYSTPVAKPITPRASGERAEGIAGGSGVRTASKDTDWDNIAVGKCQTAFLAAYIQSGKSFSDAMLQVNQARRLAEKVVYGEIKTEKEELPIIQQEVMRPDGRLEVQDVSPLTDPDAPAEEIDVDGIPF